jgi:Ca2+-transporting ATPase
MYRMAKVNTIVKRLPAVETLGSTSVICSDKTGTMTKGEMTVTRVYISKQVFDVSGAGYSPRGKYSKTGTNVNPKDYEGLIQAVKIGALCNDARLDETENGWTVLGGPTEGALLVAAFKAGINVEYLKSHSRLGEVPFTSERKMMTTINAMEDHLLICSKGAVESLLKPQQMS